MNGPSTYARIPGGRVQIVTAELSHPAGRLAPATLQATARSAADQNLIDRMSRLLAEQERRIGELEESLARHGASMSAPARPIISAASPSRGAALLAAVDARATAKDAGAKPTAKPTAGGALSAAITARIAAKTAHKP